MIMGFSNFGIETVPKIEESDRHIVAYLKEHNIKLDTETGIKFVRGRIRDWDEGEACFEAFHEAMPEHSYSEIYDIVVDLNNR